MSSARTGWARGAEAGRDVGRGEGGSKEKGGVGRVVGLKGISRASRVSCGAREAFLRQDLASGLEEFELPESLLDPEKVPLLISNLDAEQAGMSAMAFLRAPVSQQGMGLMMLYREDCFHRQWNCVKHACADATGHFQHTVVQMTLAFDINYGPFLTAGWLTQKRDIIKEYLRFKGTTDFLDFADLVACETGQALPLTDEELGDMFQANVMEHPHFTSKGPKVQMRSWFSFFRAAAHYDSCWASWVELSNFIVQDLLGDEVVGEKVQKIVDRIGENPSSSMHMSPHQMKHELMQVKKASTNALRLSATLLTDDNLVNLRIMLLAGGPCWEEHKSVASLKHGPQENLARSIALADGSGWEVCRRTWLAVTAEPGALRRMGLRIPGAAAKHLGLSEGVILRRLVSFALRLVHEKVWEYAWYSDVYPGAFARCLNTNPELRSKAFADCANDWGVLVFLERAAHKLPDVSALMNDMPWCRDQLVQYTFRLMAHHDFSPESPIVLGWLTRLFAGIGDTAMCENTHREVRAMYSESWQDERSNKSVYACLSKATVNKSRGLGRVQVEKEDFGEDMPQSEYSVHRLCNPKRRDGVSGGEVLLKTVKPFPSPNAVSGRKGVSAWHALGLLKQRGHLGDVERAWMACALHVGQVVSSSRRPGYYLVQASFGPAVLLLPLTGGGDVDGSVFFLVPVKDFEWEVVLASSWGALQLCVGVPWATNVFGETESLL